MHQIFGHFVRAYRLMMDLTQKELAERAHMTEALVSLIELNRFNRWRPKTLERLARVFNHMEVTDLRKLLPPQTLGTPPTPLGKLVQARRLEQYLTREEVDKAAGRNCGYIAGIEEGEILGLQSRDIPQLASTLKMDENELTPFLSAHQLYEVLPQHEQLRKLASEKGIRQKTREKKERLKIPKPPRLPVKLGRPRRFRHTPEPPPSQKPPRIHTPWVQKEPGGRLTRAALMELLLERVSLRAKK